MSKTLTSGQVSKEFTDIELMKALYDIQDILERALCSFVLLGETARSLKEKEVLQGDGVYLGIMQKHATKQALSTITTYLKEVHVREDGFDYEFKGVPIHVRFITRDYPFLKYLDFRFYQANQYQIPNPFEAYWEVREQL